MDFEAFSSLFSKIEKLPLPGKEAHCKMTSEARARQMEVEDYRIHHPKEAAVMAIFYPNPHNKTHLLFIKRANAADVHANQIGFPGGRIEPSDATELEAALRESNEEVGVDLNRFVHVIPLSSLYIPPSNFLVKPFMGLYDKRDNFSLQATEVAGLLEVSLDDILDDRLIFHQKIETNYALETLFPAFNFQNEIVWGATAMMLNEIRTLIRQVL